MVSGTGDVAALNARHPSARHAARVAVAAIAARCDVACPFSFRAFRKITRGSAGVETTPRRDFRGAAAAPASRATSHPRADTRDIQIDKPHDHGYAHVSVPSRPYKSISSSTSASSAPP